MEFKKRIEIVDGVEYTLTEMDAGTALRIQDEFLAKGNTPTSAMEWGRTILAASLRRDLPDLLKLPATHFAHMNEILGPISLEINGFKVSKEPGEAEAGATPADSTSESLSVK